MRTLWTMSAVFLAGAFFWSPTSQAEEGGAHKNLARTYDKTLYTKARFEKSDTNGDGVLDQNEINAAAKNFEKKYGSKRLAHADTNGDGKLSLEEARVQKQFEKTHKKQIWDKYQNRNRASNDNNGTSSTASRRRYLEEKVTAHPNAARTIRQDALANSDKARTVAKAARNHPGRAKYGIDKADDNPQATRKVYREGKNHQRATKSAWQNPNKSRRVIEGAENNRGLAKRGARAASTRHRTVKKAWRNPGTARQRVRGRRARSHARRRR